MKATIISIIAILVFGYSLYAAYVMMPEGGYFQKEDSISDTIDNLAEAKLDYSVTVEDNTGNTQTEQFETFQEAQKYAEKYDYATIVKNGETIWNTDSHYQVYEKTIPTHKYDTYQTAVKYARTIENSYIYYTPTGQMVYDETYVHRIPESKYLNVPHTSQLPKYERGSGIASIKMLMDYVGYNNITLDELYKELPKDATEYLQTSEKTYFGNPHIGFVGDIFDNNQIGYGVYIEPLIELFKKYYPNNVANLTGSTVEELQVFISQGHPVIAIINETLSPVSNSDMVSWTLRNEDTFYGVPNPHAVVIVGYDEYNLYINDPLDKKGNTAISKEQFNKAYEQAGNQAMTFVY